MSVFLALSFYCLIFLQFPAQTTSLFEFCFCQYTKSFFLRVFFVLEARYTFASTLPTHFAHLISTHPPLFQHLKDLDSRQGGGNRSNKRIGTLTVVRVDNGNIIAHMEASLFPTNAILCHSLVPRSTLCISERTVSTALKNHTISNSQLISVYLSPQRNAIATRPKLASCDIPHRKNIDKTCLQGRQSFRACMPIS